METFRPARGPKKVLRYSNNQYGDPKVKKILEDRARTVLNSSPEPRHAILVDRLIIDMAEKERVGLTFNRTVTESMADRWHDLECLNARFLQDVVNMEEQIKEDIFKCEREMDAFIANRTQVLTLASNFEQMAGLVMHVCFYNTVLTTKIESLKNSYIFLQRCTEPLGFSHPTQIIDRYESLRNIFEELFNEFEQRSNVLNRLQEEYNSIVEKTIKQNMVKYTKMADLNDDLKRLKNENVELEKFLASKLEVTSKVGVIIYKVKISIFQIYSRMLQYRGLEAVETESGAQLEKVKAHIKTIEAVIQIVQDQIMNSIRKHKGKSGRSRHTSTKSFLTELERGGSYGSESSLNSPANAGEFDSFFDLIKSRSDLKEVERGLSSASGSNTFATSYYKKKNIKRRTRSLEMKRTASAKSQEKMQMDESDVAGNLVDTTNNKNAVLDKSNSSKIEKNKVDQNEFRASSKAGATRNRITVPGKRQSVEGFITFGSEQNYIHNANKGHETAPFAKGNTASFSLGYQQNDLLSREQKSRLSKSCSAEIGIDSHQAKSRTRKKTPVHSEEYSIMLSDRSPIDVVKIENSTQDLQAKTLKKSISTEGFCLGKDKIPGKSLANVHHSKIPSITKLTPGFQPTNTFRTSEDLYRCPEISSCPGNETEFKVFPNKRPAFNITHPSPLALSEKVQNGCKIRCGKKTKGGGKAFSTQESIKDLDSNVHRCSTKRVAAVKPCVTFRKSYIKDNTLPSPQLGWMNKQYMSAMKHLGLKEGKIKADEKNEKGSTDDKHSNTIKNISLESVDKIPAKHYPNQSGRTSSLSVQTAEQISTKNMLRFAGSNTEKVSLSRTISLPKLSQTSQVFQSKVLDPRNKPSTFFRLRKMKPQRLLGELCARRRTLRDNCLNILAQVNLHSQRAQDMGKGEGQ